MRICKRCTGCIGRRVAPGAGHSSILRSLCHDPCAELIRIRGQRFCSEIASKHGRKKRQEQSGYSNKTRLVHGYTSGPGFFRYFVLSVIHCNS